MQEVTGSSPVPPTIPSSLPLRVAVLASGRGTNLQRLIERFPNCEEGSPLARVVLVVSDNPRAGALDRAQGAGIPVVVCPPAAFATSEEYGWALRGTLAGHGADLVVLAGFLKRVPPNCVAAYRGRMLNIHPALLPHFGGKGMYGARVQEAVLASGMRVSGATVHFVDEEYDHGPILLQRTVPVFAEDDPESLAARILRIEHEILPRAVELLALGRARIEGNRVRIEGEREEWERAERMAGGEA